MGRTLALLGSLAIICLLAFLTLTYTSYSEKSRSKPATV